MSSLLQEADNSIHSRSRGLSEQNQEDAFVVAPNGFEDILLGLDGIAR